MIPPLTPDDSDAAGERLAPPHGVRRIVVVQTQRMGDLLCLTPMLAALQRELPEARVAVIAQAPGDALLRGNPAVDTIFRYDRRTVRTPAGLMRFVRQLRAWRAEWALTIHAAAWVSVALALARIPRRTCVWRYGEARPPRWSRLYGERVVQTRHRTRRHEVEHNLAVLRALGLAAEPGPLAVYLDDEDRAEAERALAQRGVGEGEPLVALHPGHAGGRQEWPAAHYVAVGRELAAAGARILVTGAGREAAIVARVAERIGPAAVALAGAVSVRGLAALLARCRVLVCVPTGPMHLAAAMGVPTVVLFGPEQLRIDRIRFRPWCAPYVAIESPRRCDCADYRSCARPVCLEAITPERVLAAVQPWLAPAERTTPC